jgi:23S rRNA-/tRNA-specific pseudouridylate synthase
MEEINQQNRLEKFIKDNQFKPRIMIDHMHQESKFKTGDKVRIVGYGSIMWVTKSYREPPLKTSGPFDLDTILYQDNDFMVVDTRRNLVGQEGVVEKSQITQGKISYAIQGPSIYAWYDEKQLELI